MYKVLLAKMAAPTSDENLSKRLEETGEDSSSEKSEFDSPQYLSDAVRSTVNHACSELRHKMFAKNFPTIHKLNPSRLKELSNELIQQIKMHSSEEVELFFSQYRVVDKLKELDGLRSQPRCIKVAWRPSGNPRVDFLPHVISKKQNEILLLKEKRKICERQTRDLQAKVEFGRSSLSKITDELKEAMEQLDEIDIPTIVVEEI